MTRKSKAYILKYTFGVEGKTEKLYLKRLNSIINENKQSADIQCLIDVPYTGRSPKSARRKMNSLTGENFYFLADRERAHEENAFQELIKELTPDKKTEKDIKFEFGYCNISFELWLLLHKNDFSTPICSPEEYLPFINQTFNRSFERLDDFKNEKNLNKILENLTLEDVKKAIHRAETLQKRNQRNGFKPKLVGQYSYYNENPSLTVQDIIRNILQKFDLAG